MINGKFSSNDELIGHCKRAGLYKACKAYIEFRILNSEEGSYERLIVEYLEIRERYEDDPYESENLIGASVGMWYGLSGDKHWHSEEDFSISSSSTDEKFYQ